MYKTLSIYGYRGFSKKQVIPFAIPDEESGKLGLTMIVGGNNSGKSTIFEAMGFLSRNAQLTVQPKRRNTKTNSIAISATFHDDSCTALSNGQDECAVLNFESAASKAIAHDKGTIIKIPSRRHFSEYFSYSPTEIAPGLGNNIFMNRGDHLHQIGNILNNISNDTELRKKLNILMREIVGIDLKWSVEVSDENINTRYIKFEFTNGSHTSEGLGEGLISLFVILLPFIEEKKHSTITIDEPELSLHPALQRRLFSKLIEFSKKQQIILNTHSPYFVDLGLVLEGAKILRVFKNSDHEIELGELSSSTVESLRRNIGPIPRHPQYFGLDMKEILFAEDRVILTEGQEDIVCFKRGMLETKTTVFGDFFGWGAGGRDNIQKVCQLLKDLKYKFVVGVFDNEAEADIQKNLCEKNFSPEYSFFSIPTPDIRDKKDQDKEIKGMFDENFKLKENFKPIFKKLIKDINKKLEPHEQESINQT